MTLPQYWNPLQKELRELIKKPENLKEAVALAKNLHAQTHQGKISGSGDETYMDTLLNNLSEDTTRIMPTKKDVTIVWDLWHMTRIEDLTLNLLVAEQPQVLNEGWHKQLHTKVKDTGNAMTDPEILSLSGEISFPALLEYQAAVGKQTREIINSLSPADLRRKVNPEQIEKILEQGGVTSHPDSIWLLEFWGKKDVAGILLMPVTRHRSTHLNSALKLKAKIQR